MKIAIVEDEQTFAHQLEDYLKQFAVENQIEIDLTFYDDGSKIIGDYRPQWDLILLDIEMPTMDGMTTAFAIREQDPAVLLMFVTNLAQYAIKGYEVDAVDYVLKPINYQAFSMKMQKILRIYRNTQEQFVLLKKDGVTMRIPLSRIYYIEVSGHRLIYHTTEGNVEKSGETTLTALEKELREYGFWRCNSCYLVNMRLIKKLSTNQTVCIGGDELAISRGRKAEFLKHFMEYARGR